jgi:mono/diheme cytochrome c family protein
MKSRRANLGIIVSALALLSPIVVRPSPADAGAPDLSEKALATLKVRCVACHGPTKQEAELNLSLPPTIVRGGEDGPVVVPNKPDDSLLWQRVSADEMPPDEPLPAAEKALLRSWIAAGATGLPRHVSAKPDGDEHWAFQKLRPRDPPAVRNKSIVRTQVDQFIQARLEAVGLSIGPESDRARLIRRVAIDLTGLPPTPEEIAAFFADQRDDAYEQMVERYLASPRYGERWGKFWLDAAGYADSNGYFGADTNRPLAYRYRDYVVRSVNADKPFDQFIREQLAGDELAGYGPNTVVTPEVIELLEATHYLRNSPDGTDSSDGNADEKRADKYAVLEGTLQIMGSSLFGLTVQCARCHDHKFEPFSQHDYYQLQAILYPAFNLESWVTPKNREVLAAPAAEVAAWKERSKKVEQQIAERRRQFADWARVHREQGQVLFEADFDAPGYRLANSWSNSAPGDDAPAGQPGVNIDSPTAPGAQVANGRLRIVESRDAGDRAFSTRQPFDWTPEEEGSWIQVTFDLIAGGDTAPYVGYFIALRDFNDTRGEKGGNVLMDGAATGKATVYVDYPGADAQVKGQIGASGYTPGSNYGVRVTNRGQNKFELAQVVDGVVEEGTVMLSAEDLPDGGFGFEYCCGRSFAVDNVVVETMDRSPAGMAKRKMLAKEHAKKRQELRDAVTAMKKEQGEPPGRIAAVCDLSPKPPDVYLLERGSYKSRKEKVPPAAPAVLSEASNPALLSVEVPESSRSTGRRLAFARWLTKPDSRAAARLARVTVNRWWQHHFGTGIVATTDNLGYSGAPPSHPELLEYLASQLVEHGWSAKELHRVILRSAVYRQSSAHNTQGAQVDPDNRLLWRSPLRRLDAESLRDSMLAVAGELDLQMGGPYVPTKRAEDGDVIVDEAAAGSHRRSVYLQQRRTQVLGLLEVFDAPSIVFNCTLRLPTTVPLQSLKLMNSAFVRARAEGFARRLQLESETDVAARVRRAYVLAAARQPTAAELSSAMEFLSAQPAAYPKNPKAGELAWVDFCQALLASNVFLYVD